MCPRINNIFLLAALQFLSLFSMADALNDSFVNIQKPQSISSFLSTPPSAPNSSLVSLKAINATFSNHSTRVKDQAWDKAVLAEHERLSLDCAKHIDPDWYRWMSEHPVQPSDELVVPVEYLFKCLLEDKKGINESPPFSLVKKPEILYNVGINEILDLDFDGSLVAKITMILQWKDPRLQWKENTNLPGWKFPDMIYFPNKYVWKPRFRLANSGKDDSYLLAVPDYTIELRNDGSIIYEVEKVIRASCNLDMKMFPVDVQNCALNFIESEVHDGHRIKLNRRENTYVYYMYKNEQWLVTYVGHDPKPFYLKYLKYHTKGRWNVSLEYNSNLSFRVNLKLYRYPQFYVLNLVIPTLLVAMTGVACIFLPPASDSKLNMAITVVLTYIFLQALVADLSPRTPTSPLFARYILSSLLLAAFHVVACGLVWKLSILPSRPHRCFQFLFMCYSPLLFFKYLSHFSHVSGLKSERTKSKTFAKMNRTHQNDAREALNEALRIPKDLGPTTQLSMELDGMEAIAQENHQLPDNSKALFALNPVGKRKIAEPKYPEASWQLLALVLNRLISTLYLIGNVMVYIIYLHPIVHRLIDEHHEPINYFDAPQSEYFEDWE